jgi:hypothetical protein
VDVFDALVFGLQISSRLRDGDGGPGLGSFTQVSTFPSTAFKDPALPNNFAPFGIASIEGKIYVTFAEQDADQEDDVAGPGKGAVDVFAADNGLLLQRLVLNGGPAQIRGHGKGGCRRSES